MSRRKFRKSRGVLRRRKEWKRKVKYEEQK